MNIKKHLVKYCVYYVFPLCLSVYTWIYHIPLDAGFSLVYDMFLATPASALTTWLAYRKIKG